jgi:hypothetical protein
VEPCTVEEKTNLAAWPLSTSFSGPRSIVVSGASTTVKYQRAGVGSPVFSSVVGSMTTARTRNRWSPSGSEYMTGVTHSPNASPFIEHSNVASELLLEKSKATVASPPNSGFSPAVTSFGP